LVSRAWQLLADGDVRGARDAIRAGLTKYPNAPRLSQLQESLDRKFQEIRQKDLDELRRIERESHSAADPQTIADYSLRLDSFAQRYEGDAEFQSSAHALRRHLETVMMRPSAGTAPAPVPVPAVLADARTGTHGRTLSLKRQPRGLGLRRHRCEGEPWRSSGRPQCGPGEKRKRTWIVIGVLAGLLAVLIPIAWLFQRQKSLANSAA
jgi:hypothetical protein